MNDDRTKLKIVADFKHDGQCYFAGELRKVPAADAVYFCSAGWAESSDFPTGAKTSGDVTLDVHDAHISNSGELING